jgi:hypothetical protein
MGLIKEYSKAVSIDVAIGVLQDCLQRGKIMTLFSADFTGKAELS